MTFVLGSNCKLYRNAGSYGTPDWQEIENTRDVDLGLQTGEADVSTRNNNGWEAVVAALLRGELTFGMIYDTADADFAAIQTVYFARGTIEFAVADGPIGTSGTQYWRGTCMITGFDISQPLTGPAEVGVTVKPTYAANAPSWNTVP